MVNFSGSVGPWRSWERASMASRRSWVRIPSAPPEFLPAAPVLLFSLFGIDAGGASADAPPVTLASLPDRRRSVLTGRQRTRPSLKAGVLKSSACCFRWLLRAKRPPVAENCQLRLLD